MPKINLTLVDAQTQPLTSDEKLKFKRLARLSDAEIDFSDQPEITDAAIADGSVKVVSRGGRRIGAGRKPLGKHRKTVKLSPAAIKRYEAYAKRNKLKHFSDALEAASELLK